MRSPRSPWDCRTDRSWRSVHGTRCRCRRARLRAQGGIVEIGVDDLAMDPHEAGPLLVGAGVELADADLDDLVRRTEGWPVGLYLAALGSEGRWLPGGGRSDVDRR